PTDISALSLHDALPIFTYNVSGMDAAGNWGPIRSVTVDTVQDAPELAVNAGLTAPRGGEVMITGDVLRATDAGTGPLGLTYTVRSEEHTSELQSLAYLV